MSISRRTAGCQAVVCSFVFAGMLPSSAILSGQMLNIPRPAWSSQVFPQPQTWSFDIPSPAPQLPAGAPLVSADFLRHPLSDKAKRVILDAQHRGERGDHLGAIAELRRALDKFPKEAPYLNNMLGLQFVAAGDVASARDAFKHVLDWMPHISANHSNYGLTLAVLGDERAEEELRTALLLDETNHNARDILEALRKADQRDATAKTN